MPSSFNGSDQGGGAFKQFDDDHPRQEKSPEFNSFSSIDDAEVIKDSAAEDFVAFTSPTNPDSPSVIPIYGSGGGFDSDTVNFTDGNYEDGPILPPPAEMLQEEGYALREWRRQNAVRLEEKEKIEKEVLSQIIDEAEEYKVEFYKKNEIARAANKSLNRDKEQLFVSSLEKFHVEADKSYWKAIAELIPNEVPKIEKRGKKEQENKPSVAVIHGPKPGKPADLSRMRQILVKLKHNPPAHLKQQSPVVPVATIDAKHETAVAAV